MHPCLEHPVVRHVEQTLLIGRLAAERPLRVLGMVAAPVDRQPLDVVAERATLESALAPLVDHGQVRLSWVNGETWSDLQARVSGLSRSWLLFCLVYRRFGGLEVYDLVAWCPAFDVEGLDEVVLGRVGLGDGQHATDPARRTSASASLV
jgi:hypothetical protein